MTSTTTSGSHPSSLVWIDARHAIVAHAKGVGKVSMVEIDRGADAEAQYLAHVVHEIGNGSCVMVTGSSSAKLALEREFVSISHRPDLLIAPVRSTGGDEVEFFDRLRRLAA